MNPYLIILILSIVEGLTEFLPISSTGHMILVDKFINNTYFSKAFMDNFYVVVQLGAILAVVICFWGSITPFVKSKEEFLKRFKLWLKLGVALIPAVLIGLKFEDIISSYFMDNVVIIASTLIFYGIIFILIEKYLKNSAVPAKVTSTEKISFLSAFAIGAFQCLAMIPGTSRSGATIIGGLLLGLSRGVAAEFSFLLAIPTMFGATALKLWKNGLSFSTHEWIFLGLGTFVSFIVAYIAIKWFMGYIKKKDFIPFGIYRIILGIVVLLFVYLKK